MTDSAPPEDGSSYGPAFWVAAALGVGTMGVGVWLFLDATPDADRRISFVTWLVGLDLAHDLVVVPVVLGVATVLSRWVSGAWRAPVQAGVIVSTVVVLVALLPLRNTAAAIGNPSIQPLDYRTGTLTVLALVWAGTVAWGLWRSSRGRR